MSMSTSIGPDGPETSALNVPEKTFESYLTLNSQTLYTQGYISRIFVVW